VTTPTPEQGTDRSAALIRTLAVTVFLEWLGSTAIIPMLPVYVRHLGGTDGLAGLVMASFFATGVLTQYPVGKLADRIGRRPVLMAGLVVYSLASFAFLLPITAVDAVVLRGVQGIGAGAATVASLAMAAGAVAVERRGRAFAAVYGAQIAGMAVGPLVGSIVGVGRMHLLFLGSGLATLAACIPAARLVEAPPGRSRRADGAPAAPLQRVRWTRATIGGLVASGGLGLFSGCYDICWTLLLVSRGAASWEIGLSWTLFAVPFVVLARPAGWMADHLDRKALVLGGGAIAVAFCAGYPFIHLVPVLITLGAIEAFGYAAAMPALQSLLTQGAHHDEFGRIQGYNATIQTAVIAVTASAAGALFALATWIPFVATAALSTSALAVAAWLWRSVPGRVRHDGVAIAAEATAPAAPAAAQAPAGSSVEVQ
jgi:DHA1 family multidrug resistance protein-like MFS transporter